MIFLQIVGIYLIIGLLSFGISLIASKVRHGRLQPEDVFTFSLLGLIWPCYLWILIVEKTYNKWKRNRR